MYFDDNAVQADLRLIASVQSTGEIVPCTDDSRLGSCRNVAAVGKVMEDLWIYSLGDIAEVPIPAGQPEAGKRVRVRIESVNDDETYDIYVLPTNRRSYGAGTRVPKVARQFLLKDLSSSESRSAAEDLAKAEQQILFTKVDMTKQQAMAAMRDLAVSYESSSFKQQMTDLLRRYPDRTAYVAKTKTWTDYYSMRKQVLLSAQVPMLSRHGFHESQLGVMKLMNDTKKFWADPSVAFWLDRGSAAIQPLYIDKLMSAPRADPPPVLGLGEVAEVMICDGEHAGNFVRCVVEIVHEGRESYDISVQPTTDYNNANGLSGKCLRNVSCKLLRKIRPDTQMRFNVLPSQEHVRG
eukprot:gnl/TRDRNA2_/TRDRNA2_142143_c0_seq1.p2 gnl/TRDRNA2_/TRDRNA2_142143_c0~~gnl/TRDRNA2_/TRDRNA2_142143_c0_seq1.p2  ORF type:complete len:351 (-),score=72.53 gnl/TRDRNA2_/TRDRNA2_142143_c0_seq1:59-1111(-)